MRGVCFKSLNKKLLMIVLLSSSFFTVLTTSLNFLMDYNAEMEVQAQTLEQIEKSSLGSISHALWDLDEQQLSENIIGIIQLHDIISVHVTDLEKNIDLFKKKDLDDAEAEKYSITNSFVLKHGESGDPKPIGNLTIVVTNYYLYIRIFKKATVFFISQAIKTIAVSLVLLYLFNIILTRHIIAISKFCFDYDVSNEKSKELAIARSRFDKKYKDELDVLVDSLNSFVKMNCESNEKIKLEIKEKERAMNQLARLASLGEMAGNIGHEINNPLSTIDGSVHLILKKAKNDANFVPLLSFVQKISDASKRIEKISKSLSILIRNSDQDEREICPVSKVVSDVIDITFEKVKSKHIDFQTIIESPQFLININRIQIGQVLINLLNNSIHALEASQIKKMNLTVGAQGDFVYIRVQDSGPGIKPVDIDSIFIPFFTTKEVGKGTGLGLSISRRIIELHGGKLYLDTNESQTTFVIELRRADSVPKSSAA